MWPHQSGRAQTAIPGQHSQFPFANASRPPRRCAGHRRGRAFRMQNTGGGHILTGSHLRSVSVAVYADEVPHGNCARGSGLFAGEAKLFFAMTESANCPGRSATCQRKKTRRARRRPMNQRGRCRDSLICLILIPGLNPRLSSYEVESERWQLGNETMAQSSPGGGAGRRQFCRPTLTYGRLLVLNAFLGE